MLSPQATQHSGTGSITDTFETFVRQSLTDIRAGQVELRNRIENLESNINDTIEFQSRRIGELESKMNDLDRLVSKVAKAEKIIADQAEQLNKLERFSRRNNVRIIGLPQKLGEDSLALAKKLLNDKFSMADIKLERAHRDGPKVDGKPQHLLVKLNCYQDKVSILQRQHQALSSEPFYCTDDLTKIDLHEKRQWSVQAATAYKEGIKYRFVAGKWRGKGGSLAHFYSQARS